ncbi:hypothetical protein DFS34DRAFT_273225 [Phlyctochytrium arcticum]|nr:hypothetical protein DFS34DRAFT_273225 [Phlyctochytrium arcticum]
MAATNDLLPDMEAILNSLETVVAQVDSLLQPALEVPLDVQLGKLEPMQRAQLEVLMAFAINTIIFVFLKMNGVSPQDHPVKRELDRIKTYFVKLKQAAGLNKAPMKIDKAASKRFVFNALAGNSETNEEIKKRKRDAEATNFLSSITTPAAAPSPAAKAAPSTPVSAKPGSDAEMIVISSESESPNSGASPAGTPSLEPAKKKKKKKSKKGNKSETAGN